MLSEEYLASLEEDGIPFLGYITAGGLHPIIEMENEIITLDDLVGKDREKVYALKVDGDSMIEANILDGDIVFIKRGEKPRNGEIGVVNYDGETTLKYIFFEKDHVRLVPANSEYSEIKTRPNYPVELLGTYLGHVHLKGGR